MEFSKSVADRATLMTREFMDIWSGKDILYAIGSLDIHRECREEIHSIAPHKVARWDKTIADQERLLQSVGVVDDRTAIDYLDAIQPRLTGYLKQFATMRDRHSDELAQLQANFTKGLAACGRIRQRSAVNSRPYR